MESALGNRCRGSGPRGRSVSNNRIQTAKVGRSEELKSLTPMEWGTTWPRLELNTVGLLMFDRWDGRAFVPLEIMGLLGRDPCTITMS